MMKNYWTDKIKKEEEELKLDKRLNWSGVDPNAAMPNIRKKKP